ncbi:MAG: ORF6N domain-containing protein [Opitutaceae bacterium]|jgi:hypothetical protein|nr:ORF6N domain-containing protein [Opitutaceae bacterium]
MPRKVATSDQPAPPIYTVRKQQVVIDRDLAQLYGVTTGRLNEAVRRNAERFPEEFCFQLKQQEVAYLKSQNAFSSSSHGGRRTKPNVFTEHGALMAATMLKSKEAIQMSLYLIKAFVRMRDEMLASATILKRLAEIDRRLLEHDTVLQEVIVRLQPLLDAPGVDDKDEKPRIGYHPGNR